MQIRLCLVPVLLALATALPGSAADLTGEQIYRSMCAACHGPSGEGTKKYKQPLAGEKSVEQLTKLIAKTMPDDDPGTLSAADAETVAAYVHETFYSVAARERNKPPRVELSRLTVGQYRNAVADVIDTFRPAGKPDGKSGLKAEYYRGRRFRPNDRVLERMDAEVRFDFGKSSPVPDKIEPHEFSIRWDGSILAPESGDYEFIVRTEHAARLWVNEVRRPLIDAWVKSGTDTEYRGSVFLLAGRAYPLRLEFSKAKQGVDDSKKQKGPPPSVAASLALLWKLPGRVPDVIPSRNLSPSRASEGFAVSTAFPPDDRSLGWVRGTTVSKAWDQATTDAAIETAAYVLTHLDELAGVRSADREPGPGSGNPADINLDGRPGAKPAADRDKKIHEFCHQFAERAFRRPLSMDEKRIFVDRQFETAKDPDIAAKRVVLFVLKSPRFLYREAASSRDGYAVASRLSFGLWDSPPDAELLKLAAAGQLSTREQVAKQADRMLDDPRAHAKLRDFLHTWLKVDQPPDVAKDPKRFPGFDAAVAADLRASLELFLDDVLWSDGDFRKLLLADELYLNGRLAKFYGVELPTPPPVRGWLWDETPKPTTDAPFQKVKLNPDQRAGVLTHPYLMAAFAYTSETSPIHRGVFLARGVLGLAMRPTPEAFTPLPAELHPNLS
ncbi:MAG TPA: DUF1592 domain-containing protein, partial [Gemmataceae bacterium]|nr:DUF1592 domain-containing protein [Gemmataceae bacterium]